MKGKTEAGTAREYIEGLEEPRRSDLRELHRLIIRTAPKLRPKLGSGGIGYGSYTYRYASGREGDWPVLGLSSRAAYISFYACLGDGKQYIGKAQEGAAQGRRRAELHPVQEAGGRGPARVGENHPGE